ncbi:hypothetical protein HAX54_017143, partial [Datura stramonium]|nr:hypothetical protein [Datura stramonium]
MARNFREGIKNRIAVDKDDRDDSLVPAIPFLIPSQKFLAMNGIVDLWSASSTAAVIPSAAVAPLWRKMSHCGGHLLGSTDLDYARLILFSV